jgi:hypothetical protein
VFRTRPLLPQHDCATAIEPNDVERVLTDINADYGNRTLCCRSHGVLLVSAPLASLSLAGQEHGRTWRSHRRMSIGNSKGHDRKDLPLETSIQFSHLHANVLKFRARGARCEVRVGAVTSAKVHCQATSASLPSPPGCLTNISPAGSPIERRTVEALRRTSRTSAAKPGLA